MKAELFSTLMHVLELLVVVLISWFLISVFKIEAESVKIVVGLVLAALAKFARVSELSPVPDFVNK